MAETESNGISEDSQNKTNGTSTEGVRELTLTDHLNKRLLGSFLERLNDRQPDASVPESSANDNDFEEEKPQTD